MRHMKHKMNAMYATLITNDKIKINFSKAKLAMAVARECAGKNRRADAWQCARGGQQKGGQLNCEMVNVVQMV